MTTDIKELVKRLRERPFRHASESDLEAIERRQSERVKAADALEAMAAERDRMKAALRLWQDAWATGRNEPMAIAANATKIELGGDAS